MLLQFPEQPPGFSLAWTRGSALVQHGESGDAYAVMAEPCNFTPCHWTPVSDEAVEGPGKQLD